MRYGPGRSASIAVLVALGWSLFAGAFLALAPLGETRSATPRNGGGILDPTVRHTSLVQQEGVWVLGLLAIPAVLCAIALFADRTSQARRIRHIVGIMLVAFCVVGIASVGFAYLPTLLVLWAARRTTTGRPHPPLSSTERVSS